VSAQQKYHSQRQDRLFFLKRGVRRQQGQLQNQHVRRADRKRKMLDGLVDMHLANFKATGTELLIGSVRFTVSKTMAASNCCAGKNCHQHRQPRDG
jgi:hypothetical protein